MKLKRKQKQKKKEERRKKHLNKRKITIVGEENLKRGLHCKINYNIKIKIKHIKICTKLSGTYLYPHGGGNVGSRLSTLNPETTTVGPVGYRYKNIKYEKEIKNKYSKK